MEQIKQITGFELPFTLESLQLDHWPECSLSKSKLEITTLLAGAQVTITSKWKRSHLQHWMDGMIRLLLEKMQMVIHNLTKTVIYKKLQ